MKKLFEVFFIVCTFAVANAAVYVLWWALTDSGNYLWEPVSPIQFQIVENACNTIFWVNYTTWAVLVNLFLISFLSYHYYTRFSVAVALLMCIVYVSSWHTFGPYIAQSYVSIFENQAVSKIFLTEPIKRGGNGAGELILKKINDPEYKRREAAIKALGEIKYEPAAVHLGRILLNGKESQSIRGTSYLALKAIGSLMSKKYLLLFSQLDLQNDRDRDAIQRLEKNNEY